MLPDWLAIQLERNEPRRLAVELIFSRQFKFQFGELIVLSVLYSIRLRCGFVSETVRD